MMALIIGGCKSGYAVDAFVVAAAFAAVAVAAEDILAAVAVEELIASEEVARAAMEAFERAGS